MSLKLTPQSNDSDRQCTRCKVTKSVLEFFPSCKSQCKECRRESQKRTANPETKKIGQRRNYLQNREERIESARKWRLENREYYRQWQAKHRRDNLDMYREKSRKNLYKMAPGEYERVLFCQAEGCAICGEGVGEGKQFAVDHDHETGRIRGLLCHRCNLGIGYFRDYPSLLRSAAFYLESAKRGAFPIKQIAG